MELSIQNAVIVLSLVGNAYLFWDGRKQRKAALKNQELGNAGLTIEIIDKLTEKAAQILAEKSERDSKLAAQDTYIQILAAQKKASDDRFLDLAKSIGALEKSEEICKEEIAKLKKQKNAEMVQEIITGVVEIVKPEQHSTNNDRQIQNR